MKKQNILDINDTDAIPVKSYSPVVRTEKCSRPNGIFYYIKRKIFLFSGKNDRLFKIKGFFF